MSWSIGHCEPEPGFLTRAKTSFPVNRDLDVVVVSTSLILVAVAVNIDAVGVGSNIDPSTSDLGIACYPVKRRDSSIDTCTCHYRNTR